MIVSGKANGTKSSETARLDLFSKHHQLQRDLASLDSLLVAYSGGVDSALLTKLAHDVLGDRVIAVTTDSPAVPRAEVAFAKKLAQQIGVCHLVIQTTELHDENYVANPSNRCYFCKSELYSKLVQVANREGIEFIANGTNFDDLLDYRPGLVAAEEFRVMSPLKDAEMTKADVRRLAKKLNLPFWDKPAGPCLASRIPYGSRVTAQKLETIESAESYLKGLKIRELRVRHFGDKARIELQPEDMVRIAPQLHAVREKFLALGFAEVEVAELRSGSLNAALRLPASQPVGSGA
jgi:uncharacterized protein